MIYHTTSGPTYAPGSAYGTFNDLRDCVTRAIRTLEGKTFDFIAVQGVSGMSVGFPVALALDKPIYVVRKEYETKGENSHSLDLVCGLSFDEARALERKRGLFLDDFVSSGTTRRRVREAIENEGGKIVAQYTCREDDYAKL